MTDRTTPPPDWVDVPPEVAARLRERAGWLAACAWAASTYILYVLYAALTTTRSDDLRFVANAVFGIGGVFWIYAVFWMHGRIEDWLRGRALMHFRRFREWPR